LALHGRRGRRTPAAGGRAGLDRAGPTPAAISLSPSAFAVLLHLADAPGGRLQPCTLADRLSVSRPSMCGLIDGLQNKGLVARTPHGRDGRRVLVELSTAGRHLLEEHRATYDAVLDALLDDLRDSDREQLVGLLRRIGHHET
jgi:DNA-binding MarR family transcriptional regulator